ncbi:hypothetical protein AAHC03_012885 [Spirometra sp. Aus1]
MTTMNLTENATAFSTLSEWLKPDVCQPLRDPTPTQLQAEVSPSRSAEDTKRFTASSHRVGADLIPADSCVKSEPSNFSDFSGPPTSSPSPLFETKSEPPTNNETVDSSKSYSMEDLLRSEQSLNSDLAGGSIRRQKRKQPAPLQKTSLNPGTDTGQTDYQEALEASQPPGDTPEEYFSPEKRKTESASGLQREEGGGGLKRQHETEDRADLIAQLSRNTVAALTRAISKRAKYSGADEPLRGLEEELKGIVQQVLKSGLVSIGTNDCKGETKSENEEGAATMTSPELGFMPLNAQLQVPSDVKMPEATPEEAKTNTHPEGLYLSGHIPPPREIMEALGSNMPIGFDQSFSMYYEAACRVIQMQTAPTAPQGILGYLPTAIAGDQRCLPDLSPKAEHSIPPGIVAFGTCNRRRDRWPPGHLESTWHKLEGHKQPADQKTPDETQTRSGAAAQMSGDVSFGSCLEEDVLKAEGGKAGSLMSLERHPPELKVPPSHISQPSDSILASVFGLQHQLFNQPVTSGPRLLRPPTSDVLSASPLLNLRTPGRSLEEHKTQLPGEHQTEALSLVVTSAGQNRPATNEPLRSSGFQKGPTDTSTLPPDAIPPSFPPSYGFATLSQDSLMESPLEPFPPMVADSGLHPACGGGLPRKKRTKVTDTRLVSKAARTSLLPSPEFLHDTALHSPLAGSRSSPVSSEAVQLTGTNCMSSNRRPFDASPFLRLGLPPLPVGKGYREDLGRTQSQLRFESLLMSDILKSLSVTPFPQLQEAFLKERAFATPPPLNVNTGSLISPDGGSTRAPLRHPFMMTGGLPLLDPPGMLTPLSYDATVASSIGCGGNAGMGQFASFSITTNPKTSLLERQSGHQQSLRRSRSIGNKRVTNALSLNSNSTAANQSAYGGDGERAEQVSGVTKAEEDGILSSGGLSEIQTPGQGHELVPMTSTLTPIHLRKAKLMFFFTRYPNSSLLKVFFSDVRFNKNNTAQLVKWFSNFREFYYIQMEKYARVAISEGIRTASEITVTTGSELYRALALHYNRNQQIEIPEYFRFVVETTLREFFLALSTGKDVEQSWKKPIYKIIARMDQPVPEYFKNPSWMAQLADG